MEPDLSLAVPQRCGERSGYARRGLGWLSACLLLLVQDTKMSSLERNIRNLEDEVQMLKTSGLLNPDDRQDELRQVEVYKSHSKFMKTKVECLCMPLEITSNCITRAMRVLKHQLWVRENLSCACCMSPLHAHGKASMSVVKSWYCVFWLLFRGFCPPVLHDTKNSYT